jgi:hypothetical protein
MPVKPPLGRLESVSLRDYWVKEDTEFTPWLADAENLQYLSETVGMELELIDTETKVGPYRADLLCRDTNTDSYVLIENQLERTDHLHLGQLMTYAAGLETVNIIWLAQKFNEEHRAALDWLNRITYEGFHFFGIEIELWKIGDSSPAPKFNIIAKPNDWSKSIKTKQQADWGERALMYRQLWSGLIECIRKNYPNVKTPNPSGLHWIRFQLADSHGVVSYAPTQKKLSLYLLFRGNIPEKWFEHIESDAENFEKEVGHSFGWVPSDQGPGHGLMTFDFDHLEVDAHPKFFNMVSELLNNLSAALSKRHLIFS